jgi:hypothetical protein
MPTPASAETVRTWPRCLPVSNPRASALEQSGRRESYPAQSGARRLRPSRPPPPPRRYAKAASSVSRPPPLRSRQMRMARPREGFECRIFAGHWPRPLRPTRAAKRPEARKAARCCPARESTLRQTRTPTRLVGRSCPDTAMSPAIIGGPALEPSHGGLSDSPNVHSASLCTTSSRRGRQRARAPVRLHTGHRPPCLAIPGRQVLDRDRGRRPAGRGRVFEDLRPPPPMRLSGAVRLCRGLDRAEESTNPQRMPVYTRPGCASRGPQRILSRT